MAGFDNYTTAKVHLINNIRVIAYKKTFLSPIISSTNIITQ